MSLSAFCGGKVHFSITYISGVCAVSVWITLSIAFTLKLLSFPSKYARELYNYNNNIIGVS